MGGSFNNFIVKSGGNNVRGLFFYDREPLDAAELESLRPSCAGQGVTNTSSVARYQSVHGDIGGPIMRDKFWWFYGFRNLNSRQLDARLLSTRRPGSRSRCSRRCGTT